jgi:hypothetical protein
MVVLTYSAVSSTTTAPTASVDPARIAALLAHEITPTGKTPRIAALLKSGWVGIEFNALEAGTVVIDWYEIPRGAKLAKTRLKPVLVAFGKLTFPAAGIAKVRINLTEVGRRLLKRARQKGARQVELTAKGTFTPTRTSGVITTTKPFVLRR